VSTMSALIIVPNRASTTDNLLRLPIGRSSIFQIGFNHNLNQRLVLGSVLEKPTNRRRKIIPHRIRFLVQISTDLSAKSAEFDRNLPVCARGGYSALQRPTAAQTESQPASEIGLLLLRLRPLVAGTTPILLSVAPLLPHVLSALGNQRGALEFTAPRVCFSKKLLFALLLRVG
jgi:hypothetical protein